MKRLENETREEYKVRLKLWNEIMSPEFARQQQYGITREQYFETLSTATLELQAARSQGYSDEEILADLQNGTPAQILYAKFIENEILKRG